MSIKSYFPTFIYHEPLLKSSLKAFNKELLKECYQFKDLDEEGQDWSSKNYVGGYTSYSSYSNLHEVSSTFTNLQRKIDKHINIFSKHLEMELGSGTLEMIDCWLNIMPAGTSHSAHIHPLSVISGTYYLEMPKNASGIHFEDPRLPSFMASPPKKEKHKKANQQFAKIKTKSGDLVLFESWLRHGVPASINQKDRVSISFNYHWV